MDTKDFLEELDEKERLKPNYGIQWGMEASDYKCSAKGITFGKNTDWDENGTTCSSQPIFLNGKKIGILHEWVGGGFFDRMHQTFMVYIDHAPTEQERNDPHFFEAEDYWMRFAKLQDMIDYLGIE